MQKVLTTDDTDHTNKREGGAQRVCPDHLTIMVTPRLNTSTLQFLLKTIREISVITGPIELFRLRGGTVYLPLLCALGVLCGENYSPENCRRGLVANQPPIAARNTAP
jgi:hypothetical protein